EQVHIVASVAGDHRDPALILDAKAIGRLDRVAMIDGEGDDAQVAGLIDDAVLTKFFYCDCDMLAGELFVLDTNLDVVRIGCFQMMHEPRCADRADHVEWSPTVAKMRA